MIEVKWAPELGNDARRRISEIFVDAFGNYLVFFSKDPQKLAKAFEHMFKLELFYVAIIDGYIVGITSCTDTTTPSVKLNKKVLRQHLGFIKGSLANHLMKRELEKLPIETGPRKASVEFVAVDSRFRGQGVAKAIMDYLFKFPDYDEYILEVADTNAQALRLYEKCGYEEFLRIPHKYPKQSGVNQLIYMKYKK